MLFILHYYYYYGASSKSFHNKKRSLNQYAESLYFYLCIYLMITPHDILEPLNDRSFEVSQNCKKSAIPINAKNNF